MTKRTLFILLALGLILRLCIGYFQFSGDLGNHLVWGNSFLSNPLGFYSRHFSGFNDPNYPPLAIIFFGISNLLYAGSLALVRKLNSAVSIFPSLLLPLFESENMKMFFLKLPGMLSDVGIAYLLYLFSKKLKISPIISIFYLFNPAFIYTSTVWGQIEPVTSLFIILSLYLALFGKDKKLSLVAFAISVLTKQTALWLTPLFILLWCKEMNQKQLLKGMLLSVGTFFLFYLPFGLLPVDAIKNYLTTLSGSSTLVTDAAWNIWFFIFPGRVEDSVTIGFLSVRNISIILLLIALSVIMYQLLKKYSHSRFFYGLFVWALLAFILQTRVHERHLSFALLFLLLTPGLSKTYYLDYLTLSVYHYLNLYQSLGLPFIK